MIQRTIQKHLLHAWLHEQLVFIKEAVIETLLQVGTVGQQESHMLRLVPVVNSDTNLRRSLRRELTVDVGAYGDGYFGYGAQMLNRNINAFGRGTGKQTEPAQCQATDKTQTRQLNIE